MHLNIIFVLDPSLSSRQNYTVLSYYTRKFRKRCHGEEDADGNILLCIFYDSLFDCPSDETLNRDPWHFSWGDIMNFPLVLAYYSAIFLFIWQVREKGKTKTTYGVNRILSYRKQDGSFALSQRSASATW